MNYIYLRVSTDNTRQDLDQQLKAIIDKFDLKDYVVFKDEGSAYQLEKIDKREDFFKLLELMFDASKTDIKALFRGDYEKRTITLYVWDSSRIMRNLELNVQFYLLAMLYGIRIHSYREMAIDEEVAKTTSGKLMLMVMNSFNAFNAQSYSEKLSADISKAYDQDKKASTYNRKWGSNYTPLPGWEGFWSKTFKNNKGIEIDRVTKNGRLRMTGDEDTAFIKYILSLLNSLQDRLSVIDMVASERFITINQPFITKHFDKVGNKNYQVKDTNLG